MPGAERLRVRRTMVKMIETWLFLIKTVLSFQEYNLSSLCGFPKGINS